jgi:hypothetical protein
LGERFSGRQQQGSFAAGWLKDIGSGYSLPAQGGANRLRQSQRGLKITEFDFAEGFHASSR